MQSLADLAEKAQQGDGPSFYLLLEKAYYEEPGAFEAFHAVATSHPSHFYRLAQFFSHPTLSEVVFKIIQHPDFDLTPLKDCVGTQPPLLMILSGLALEGNHVGALKLLPRLEFDASVYQSVVTQDY